MLYQVNPEALVEFIIFSHLGLGSTAGVVFQPLPFLNMTHLFDAMPFVPRCKRFHMEILGKPNTCLFDGSCVPLIVFDKVTHFATSARIGITTLRHSI